MFFFQPRFVTTEKMAEVKKGRLKEEKRRKFKEQKTEKMVTLAIALHGYPVSANTTNVFL